MTNLIGILDKCLAVCYDSKKLNTYFPYPERWRDWPDEARQPAVKGFESLKCMVPIPAGKIPER
jgi:hypothetical protein